MRSLVALVLLVIGAVVLLAWTQRQTGPFFVSGFVEADDIRVGSRVGGRVGQVHVQEGQSVAAGQPLITLEPFDLRERAAEAQATLAARRAYLDRLKAGFRPEEIEQARARRDRAQAVLDLKVAGPRPLEIQMLVDKKAVAESDLVKAEKEYARVKGLHEQGQAIEHELDAATRLINSARATAALATDELALAQAGTRAEELAEARAALAEAQQALSLVENGYRQEEIAQAEAEVAAAEAAAAAIDRQIGELHITAPRDSVVDALDLEPGDLIAANAPVATLLDSRSLYVRAYVPENRLNLSSGQKVQIGVDAYPNRRFSGHITFIARQAEFTPSNVQTPEERSKQVFRIKVDLEEGEETLRPGMSADVYLDQGT